MLETTRRRTPFLMYDCSFRKDKWRIAHSSSAFSLVSSKSVGGISISYDTNTGQTLGGGTFNLTRYGQEYLTLRDSIALGARQL